MQLRSTIIAYPSSGGISGNRNDVTNDLVLEQAIASYDAVGNVVNSSLAQRFDDATGTGPLQGPADSQPRARVSNVASWFDPIGRQIAAADYGTVGGAAFVRPVVPPESSDLVRVLSMDYADSGEADQTVSPDGKVTRWVNDRLGRRIKLIENFKEGVTESDTGANRTTEYRDTADGRLEALILRNVSTGDQVTRWEYGTTLAEDGVARNDLVRRKVFPEAT